MWRIGGLMQVICVYWWGSADGQLGVVTCMSLSTILHSNTFPKSLHQMENLPM